MDAVVGIAAAVGSLTFSQRLDDAIARWFANRGVSHPYTATGLVWGLVVLTFAAVERWAGVPDGDGPTVRGRTHLDG